MSAIQQMLAGLEGANYIATPAATPAIGAAFEGGYYAGMIWNELVQSPTSTTIGTGEKVLTISTTEPITYIGQSLEVRSRANPANKMVGTVTRATSSYMVLNITSVAGSGTFIDWSIMAKYRVIVSPKASGESNNTLTYKNANTAAPVACQTLSEGRKATLAMVAAGDSTVYPAAHWCKNLSIAGKTDWYMPARDELELCSRNLKPFSADNSTSARQDSTLDYKNQGAFDDASTAMGTNLNSSPVGAAYTTTVPEMTALAIFQYTGAECFTLEDAVYKSSSELSSAQIWCRWSGTIQLGQQRVGDKNTTGGRVRAVRRSII